MSNWKRIRQSAWHPSVAHLRETEDHEACQPCFCLPASAGGASCNTAECVNRGCHMECEPSVCPCGEECKNQEIQRQALPNVECVNLGLPNSLSSIRKMSGAKGMGAIAQETIEADRLVCEYIGEVIDQKELYRRRQNEYKNMRHTYIMTYIKRLLIDATQKGNWARYLNHSCNPNCCTQKWIVAGRTRVGIFTKRRCEAGEELTYDYNLEWNGFARVKCECKASNCSGWLGGRKDSMQTQMVLHDSDDDVGSDGDDEEAVTKVSPLSLPGSAVTQELCMKWSIKLAGSAKTREKGSIHRVPSAQRPSQADTPKGDDEGLGGAEVAQELEALEELSSEEAMRRCIQGAEARYPTLYDASDMAQKLDWNATHDSIENTWWERHEVVKRLLECMQNVSVKKRVRMKHTNARPRARA